MTTRRTSHSPTKQFFQLPATNNGRSSQRTADISFNFTDANPTTKDLIVCTFDWDFTGQAQRIADALEKESDLAGQLIRIYRAANPEEDRRQPFARCGVGAFAAAPGAAVAERGDCRALLGRWRVRVGLSLARTTRHAAAVRTDRGARRGGVQPARSRGVLKVKIG